MSAQAPSVAAVGLATVALAMCTAGLSAVAHADSSCTTKWRFDGYTELRGDNGGTLTFDSSDPAINGHATEYRADGRIKHGDLYASPNGAGVGQFRAWFTRDGVVWTPAGDVYFVEDFHGSVDPDGFAHGTQVEHIFLNDSNQNPPPEVSAVYITSWRSAAPLKCADAPPKQPDVLTPEEGPPLEPLNAPSVSDVLPPEIVTSRALDAPKISDVIPPNVSVLEPGN
jgi:hypothetical protein